VDQTALSIRPESNFTFFAFLAKYFCLCSSGEEETEKGHARSSPQSIGDIYPLTAACLAQKRGKNKKMMCILTFSLHQDK
jgi:hypothetical protein